MHGRRGNYMPCKWKRKKGGCHGQPVRGKEDAGKTENGWILYRGDACTVENVNSLVFLLAPLQDLPIHCPSHTPPLPLPPRYHGPLPNLPFSLAGSSSFSFFSVPPLRPARSRGEEKARAERTDGANPSRAKSKRRAAVSWASRGSSDYAGQKEDRLGGASATDC